MLYDKETMGSDKKKEPELLKKGYDIRLYLTDFIWGAAILVLTAICLELFYRMIVDYNDRYSSDMQYYAVKNVVKGTKHDRLLGFLFQWLHDINQSTLEINIYLALVIGMIVIMNFLVMRFWLRDDGVLDKVPRYMMQLASLAALFTGPIYIPRIHEHYYLNTFEAFSWHSPTQQTMVLLSMAATLCFLRMFLRYEEGVSPAWWAASALMIFLSAFTKPSFYIGFALSVVVLFVIELFAGTFGTIGQRFLRLFIMGCSLVPAGVYMLLLQMSQFGESNIEGEEHHVVVGLHVLLEHRNVLAGFIFGMTFSIIVLAVNYRKLKESKYFLALMIFITGVMQWAFVTETGKRAKYGNFDWGKQYGTYFLAVICLALALENYYDKDSVFGGSKKARRIYFAVLAVVLLLSVMSQLKYFLLILTGHGYMR